MPSPPPIPKPTAPRPPDTIASKPKEALGQDSSTTKEEPQTILQGQANYKFYFAIAVTGLVCFFALLLIPAAYLLTKSSTFSRTESTAEVSILNDSGLGDIHETSRGGSPLDTAPQDLDSDKVETTPATSSATTDSSPANDSQPADSNSETTNKSEAGSPAEKTNSVNQTDPPLNIDHGETSPIDDASTDAKVSDVIPKADGSAKSPYSAPSNTNANNAPSTSESEQLKIRSYQRVSDYLGDRVTIFCTVQLPDTKISENNEFVGQDKKNSAMLRFEHTGKHSSSDWSQIEACRLKLPSQVGPSQMIKSATFGDIEVQLATADSVDQMLIKLKWGTTSNFTEQLFPDLFNTWREYNEHSEDAKKSLSKSVTLKATNYGRTLRKDLLSALSPNEEDIDLLGTKKVNQLESLKESLDSFSARSENEARVKIQQCENQILLAEKIPRIYYGDGLYEDVASWRNRIALAQQPYASVRNECLSVLNNLPNELALIENSIDEQCLKIAKLQLLARNATRRSPVKLDVPVDIKWENKSEIEIELPLLVHCYLEM